ncbi:MAG TPA: hypothetical protein VF861_00330 [Telluria sp.]
MTTKKLMLATLLACALAPALADELGAPTETRIERRIVTRDGETITLDSSGPVAERGGLFSGIHANGGKLLKNAPYSAEVISERQQNLADGNQIANTTRSMSYRDSAGRTRQETRSRDGELLAVTIRDAEGATWFLDARHKTATRLPAHPALVRAAGEHARARIEQLRKEGKLPPLARKGADDEQVIIKRVERADGAGQPNVQEEVRVRIAPRVAGEAAGPGLAREIHLGPMLAGAFGGMKWAAKATTKELGTREFDGIKATGRMRSYEIPAGEVGNRNPIVVSSEYWYSPELQVTVYSKHSDPRSGEIVYRLDNLKRDEPAAALFTVPSDYTVKNVMARMEKRLERKAE